jgi:hyperosmotically inducible periplasmic protein
MSMKIALAALAATGLLAGTAVHAQDQDADRSHPKEYVKDSVITTKVKTKLASEHIASLDHIRVDTDADGVVWLSGSARTQDDVDRAKEIARHTEGVRGVHSSLVVRRED